MFPVLAKKTHNWATGAWEPLTLWAFPVVSDVPSHPWGSQKWSCPWCPAAACHCHKVASVWPLRSSLDPPPTWAVSVSVSTDAFKPTVQFLNAMPDDVRWCLTLPSCACGRSVSRGSSTSYAWPVPDPAGRQPGTPRSDRVCRRERAQWNSSTSTPHRNTRCWLGMGTRTHCGCSVRSLIITAERKRS